MMVYKILFQLFKNFNHNNFAAKMSMFFRISSPFFSPPRTIAVSKNNFFAVFQSATENTILVGISGSMFDKIVPIKNIRFWK